MVRRVTALPKQRSRGPLGVARITKLAAFQAVEVSVRCEEAVSPHIPGDNSCSPIVYLDDVSFGHAPSLTGKAGLLSCFGECYFDAGRINNRRR